MTKRNDGEGDMDAPKKIPVAALFKGEHKMMLIAADVDPESVRQRFDDPEQLVICTVSNGMRALVRRGSLVHRQIKAADVVAKRMGITPAELPNLSPGRLQEMADEVEKEIARRRD